MKTSILWDITPCDLVKVDQSFGGICRLHLQSRRVSQAGNNHEAGLLLFDFHWTTRRYVPQLRTLFATRPRNIPETFVYRDHTRVAPWCRVFLGKLAATPSVAVRITHPAAAVTSLVQTPIVLVTYRTTLVFLGRRGKVGRWAAESLRVSADVMFLWSNRVPRNGTESLPYFAQATSSTRGSLIYP
jgi:hypothetical protein